MRGVAIKPWVWLSAVVFAVTAVVAAIATATVVAAGREPRHGATPVSLPGG